MSLLGNVARGGAERPVVVIEGEEDFYLADESPDRSVLFRILRDAPSVHLRLGLAALRIERLNARNKLKGRA